MKYIIATILTLTCTPVLASDYEYLLDDIEVLEAEIEELDQSKQNLEQDREYENSIELFPRGFQVIEEANVRTDSVSDEFVYVRIDDIPVILRDVPLDQWYAPYVRNVGELQIMSGYKDAEGKPIGAFGPNDSVTIAQLAKIATEASGTVQSECAESVNNATASGTWAAPYIACAETLKWSIFNDATLDVNREATRAEVVTTILEAFAVEILPGTGEIFTDVSNTFIFRGAIETAFNDGIVSGYKDDSGADTNLFGPFNTINRAEMSKVVSVALQVYKKR